MQRSRDLHSEDLSRSVHTKAQSAHVSRDSEYRLTLKHVHQGKERQEPSVDLAYDMLVSAFDH